jgi:hypothetical protein
MPTTGSPDTDAPRHRRSRRHLAVVVVFAGLVAAVPGIATLAGFTARDVNRDNTISTGVLDVAFGRDRTQFDVRNMKPGDWFDTTVDIVNTGSLEQDYSFSAIDLRATGSANLDEVLRVTVARRGEVLAENLRFSTLREITGRLASGATDPLDLRVSWPDNPSPVDNRYQGASLVLDLLVEAVQLDAAPSTTVVPTTDPVAPFGINGVAGATSIAVPYDPKVTAITVVSDASTRFKVTNFSDTKQSFRFDSTAIAEIWDGSGEWIETILFPEWGWDGHQVDLAPGETRSFIANAWEPDVRVSIVSIPPIG